uniref:PRANC domain-containing protein n=1 Tax=Trichogramma kaykai TaxID=54128 RepID=A0ABD2XML8_9HYME
MSQLKKLKEMRAAVDWNLVKERRDLLVRLFHLTSDWKVQLPNLLDVFRAEEIDWLLMEATKSKKDLLQLQRFIKFVARTGFKDEPKLDEAGKPISRRVTALHIAAESGLKVIRDLFEIYDRFDVNFTCEQGVTHFHVACEFGLDHVVKKFLDLGQDPNLLVQSTGDSPLHFAAAINYDDKTKVVELLLRRGAKTNLVNKAGQTPLHNFSIHIEDDHVDLAKFFFKICDDLRQMVSVNFRDKSGRTPLHLAVKYRNKELVALLLQRSANPNFIDQDGSTPLHYICKKVVDDGLAEMLFEFCDENNRMLRLDVQNKWDNTPLHEALECGDKKMVELLLRRGANSNIANAEGWTPLHIISRKYDGQGLAELFFKTCDDVGQTVLVDARDKEGNTPLLLALENKKSTLVQLLLRRGVDLNIANNYGTAPLHLIREYDDDEDHDLVKMFFEIWDERQQTAQINTRDKSGNTPLLLALKYHKNKLVELLLRRGADQCSANNVGETPLHLICMYDEDDEDDELVEMFFEIWDERQQTAQIDPRDKSGNTPLLLALEYHKNMLVELLLRRGADQCSANNVGETPLHLICMYDEDDEDDELVKMFFEIWDERQQTAQINTRDKSGNTPLLLALKYHKNKLVELLLRRGADQCSANNVGETPLHLICMYDEDDEDDELVEMFFEIWDERQQTAQIDPRDKSGNTPLLLALEYHKNMLVELLLRRGADQCSANNVGETPLHLICMYDEDDEDDELVEMFFEIWDERQQTVRVDVQDEKGNTPLHGAVDCGNKKVVEKLLRRGANANSAANDGMTPLHVICCKTDDEDDGMAKLFFDICDERQLKVQVDAVDKYGDTPLHLVSYDLERFTGNPQLIELLLEKGADPSTVNKGGITPLHLICKRASSRDELLVMFPRLAQLDVVDKLGRTPLRWAVENLVPRVVDILLDHGADLSSFVFPTPSDFAERLDTRVFSSIYVNFKLIMASSLLSIAENLEQRGYEFSRSDALTIMKFFAERNLFEKPSNLDKCWYEDEKFVSKAKEIIIRHNDPSLSLYEWSKLTSEEEEKLLTYEDYFTFVRFDHLSILPEGVEEACQLRLCEMMSRGFFRRWALDPYMNLIRYRLPIICCEQILSNMMNEDLYHICLADA